MNYRAFVKKQLMGGKLYKVRGFGIGAGSRPSMQLNNYHGAGTISHRAVVGPLIPDFGSLSIARQKSGAGRIRKIYDDEPKAGKGLSKKFNSLKFNF
jgi:hypothetical protein